jgi:hypothetical protein
MAKTLDETGVIQVNGAWATSVKYSSAVLGADSNAVDLRFMQGRAEVARVSLPRDQLGSVLGEPNRDSIERHLASDADKYLAVVTGELRGQRLHYREVTLAATATATQENAIRPTPARDRDRSVGPDAQPQSTADPMAGHGDKNPDSTASTDKARDSGESQQSTEDPAATSEQPAVPTHIAAKYLVKGNAYHFDDQTVAFVDQGRSLTAQTHNKAIIQDLIQIAKSRDWQEITVSGSRAFRREAWREAATAGLTVSGYSASALERAAVERKRGREEGGQRKESPAPNGAAATTDRPSPQPAAPQTGARGMASRDVVYGQLVAHGEAPYRHDPNQSRSYFVTIKGATGAEQTTWGVGLKEALRQSQTSPTVNDVVGIRRAGTTPVTVVQRSVDENGEITAQTVGAKRQAWELEKAEYFTRQSGAVAGRESPSAVKEPTLSSEPEEADRRGRSKRLTQQEGVVAAVRSAATTREELQLKYPELNKAIFQELASHDRFADAYVKAGLIRESDREQVIAQMRERLAGRIERGVEIREPNDKQVNALINRSVNRVAADIGRAPVEIEPRTPEPPLGRTTVAREDVQVRA